MSENTTNPKVEAAAVGIAKVVAGSTLLLAVWFGLEALGFSPMSVVVAALTLGITFLAILAAIGLVSAGTVQSLSASVSELAQRTPEYVHRFRKEGVSVEA